MQILDELRQRFAAALVQLASQLPEKTAPAREGSPQAEGSSRTEIDSERITSFARMVRPTTDSRHGDYQANCAMPLSKLLGVSTRVVAEQLVGLLEVGDLCEPPQIAGPGFINLKIRDDYLAAATQALLADSRLGVTATETPLNIVVDYSGPNVAKPMHVGHIRSTVIGDSVAKVLRFLGHHVITDNHLGDWGTQFGMVIYGFKHFGSEAAFEQAPVAELSRLYRLVNRFIEYHNAVASTKAAENAVTEAEAAVKNLQAALASVADPKEKKAAEKALSAAERKLESTRETAAKLKQSIESIEADAALMEMAQAHPRIAAAVLEETVKLHAGDEQNLQLWHRFLPHCKDEINRVYARLNVSFDHVLGESFYHPMLQEVVDNLKAIGLASESEGAVCVFLPEFDAPMIVQKRDGAFLYATTDLATLEYRRMEFNPHEILYVVDSRQSEHFDKLFAVARRTGFEATRLAHVNFGTVLGEDGKPFKTRSGSSIGLEALLDDAVARAYAVVCNPERSSKIDPPLSDTEKLEIANVVGHGAIKYADLSHHRTSDYKFDLEKMVALEGNTSAYIQYAYARVQGILTKGKTAESRVISDGFIIHLNHPAERTLALQLLRFGESLEQVRTDYAPNFLVDYLYETAKAYAVFNDNCPVLKADDENVMKSRLALVAATGRMLRQGLELLGIGVVSRM
jgi:arginyl-tRNA synthetase